MKVAPEARVGPGTVRALVRALLAGALVACAGSSDRGPGIDPLAAQESPPGSPRSRVYYLAAEEVAWDYAPGGEDRLKGARFDTTTALQPCGAPPCPPLYANVRSEHYDLGQAGGLDGIGRVYRKVLYRRYADSTFTERALRPPEWEHLGFLGPLLRGAVGDTIVVVFRNRGGRPYSVHPHGVFYGKDSEGFGYRDGTGGADRDDDAVPPGGTHRYVWPVPERAGPGPGDPSSVLWMYHSHVHEDEDIATGLMGPMIVTARDMAGPDAVPRDVDRELVTMFSHAEELDSWLYRENVRRRTALPVDSALRQPFFESTNRMDSINGWMYGTMPMPVMRRGERVRWYVFSGTNERDTHTVHWHGQTAVVGGRRTDMIEVGPMMTAVADMIPDNPGVWLYHCHVDVHFEGGMSALFRVLPP